MSKDIIGSDEEIRALIRQKSRRSFIFGGIAAASGYFGWRYLVTRPDIDGIAAPFRYSHMFNEQLSEAFFDPTRLAPVFPEADAQEPRVNGRVGLMSDLDVDAWKLTVTGLSASVLTLTMEDIYKLPKIEMTTELKCIEGWSTVVRWAGARFADFVGMYKSASTLPPYVSLTTPDNEYYVGMDLASSLHPQTLLCYEMNGEQLTLGHGAPLRLVTPVKYGIKHIKRIGEIAFTEERPADYWAERGYDWYSAH